MISTYPNFHRKTTERTVEWGESREGSPLEGESDPLSRNGRVVNGHTTRLATNEYFPPYGLALVGNDDVEHATTCVS